MLSKFNEGIDEINIEYRRLQSNNEYTWVECKKKCGMKTGVYHKFIKQHDQMAEDRAIMDWNRMVKQNG